MKKILELKDINKSFSGIQVLFNVNLTLHEGEVVCLVGENGAGKSTLIKILSGAEKPDSGEIEYFNTTCNRMTPKLAMEAGIATIYQDVDLVDTLSVADNIFQGSEIKKGFFINKKEQEKRTQELLNELSIKMKANEIVENLSPGQKQNLQIVKALHKKAKIIIMDEPTASLGEEETEALMKLVSKMKSEGMGIIYISHYFEEIFKVGDYAVVLKDGHTVCRKDLKKTDENELIKDMVGRDVSGVYHKGNYSQHDHALQIKNYNSGKRVKDVSFSVSHGEIIGLGGLVGAGRTELVRLLFGADKKDTGTMILNEKKITPSSPQEAIKNGICFISEDRKKEGLFLERSVNENIMIVENESRFWLNKSKEKIKVEDSIQKLSIKVFDHHHEAGKLSGGNQQKVVISKWLVKNGEIFIFDEPSKGVDVGAREEIYKLMENLVQHGKIIIMISSNMPELLSMSDRIGIMRDGELVNIIPIEEATEDKLLKEYIGI